MHAEGHQPIDHTKPAVAGVPSGFQPKEFDLSKTSAPSLPVDGARASGEPEATLFTYERYSTTDLPSAETAQQVIDLFVTVYGGTHNRETLKSPESYRDEVRSGGMIPFIARDANGKVVAHTGILSLGCRAVELGYMLADPAARRHGLAATLRDQALRHIDQLAAEGVVDVIRAECVTAHVSTQKFAKVCNFTVTGILDRKFYDMFESNRDETFVRFEYLKNPAIKEHRTVYIPSIMYVMSENIYKELGYARSIAMRPDHEALAAPIGPAEVARETHELGAWGALAVEFSPGVTPFQMAQEIEREFAGGVKHLAIRVNISHPAAIDQINALRTLGFYFAALEPTRECDYLLMQRRSVSDGSLCAPGEVSLFDETARTLLSLIRASQLS